jgi:hypothetical protein
VIALDANMILASRYVAYYANSAGGQTSKTGFAGDLMKAVVAENVSSTANDYTGTANVASGLIPARGIPASLYAVQVNACRRGQAISMSFSWRQVLAVFQDMADASNTAGIYIAFDTITDGFGHLEFRTYANQRGNDHRLSQQPDHPGPLFGQSGRNFFNLRLHQRGHLRLRGRPGHRCGPDGGNLGRYDQAGPVAFRPARTLPGCPAGYQLTQVQDAADAALRGNRGQVIYDSKDY